MSSIAPDRLRVLKAGFDHLNAGRFQDAATLCAPLAARRADDIEATLIYGIARAAMGEVEEGADCLAAVARARPAHAHPCSDLAATLRRFGCIEEAEAHFRAALRRAPDHPKLLTGLAELLQECGRPAEAVPLLQRCVRLHPAFAPAQTLLGVMLGDAGRMEEAIAQFRSCLAQAPGDPPRLVNLASALATEGRFGEALALYDAAILRDPGNVEIRIIRAMALLKSGRLREGWNEFEWRLRQPGRMQFLHRQMLRPLAPGAGLHRKTVLLTQEAGLGDTIQFLRYAPLLAERGARVLAWVPDELARITGSVPGIARAFPAGAPLPAFDFHCSFQSLGHVFGTELDTIPAAIPYIHADPELAARWRARLPPGKRVGLVWAGAARPHDPVARIIDQRRSMKPAALAPLGTISGIAFVSLQKDAAEMPPDGLALHDPMPDVSDFADTAAIIANLDAVVSVDTSVAHLAGAMGKPVLLLDRYDNCWRWLHGRTDSPWYPGLRIFRQPRPGDWASPVQQVAAELAAPAR